MSFLVRDTVRVTRRDSGNPVESHSYWFGPNHLWGKTWSTTRDDLMVERFVTRRQAREAVRRFYSPKEIQWRHIEVVPEGETE